LLHQCPTFLARSGRRIRGFVRKHFCWGQAHDRTLDAHLDVEEEAVVPLLLALDPEEFDRYYRSPLSMLIPADRR